MDSCWSEEKLSSREIAEARVYCSLVPMGLRENKEGGSADDAPILKYSKSEVIESAKDQRKQKGVKQKEE